MRLPWVVAAALSLAGCIGPSDVDPRALDAETATPPVVVAVIDSGVNPYHVAFRGGPAFDDVPGFGEISRPLALSLDAPDYAAAVARDEALWRSVEAGEIVRFPGTRLAAYSFSKTATPSHVNDPAIDAEHFVRDEQGHGTLVSHAVVDASPHVVVLMVQVGDDEQIGDAMRWIATQPWIDLVSVSWATWAEEIAMGEARMGLPEAYREAARAGKLIFNGAGNEPTPHFAGEHSGPPFVVAVGGAHNQTGGDMLLAARFPDVVSAFAHVRAEHDSMSGTRSTAGTSLSTPWVAGSVAEALWLVREGAGDPAPGVKDGALVVAEPGAGLLDDGALTADELRAAMNRAAGALAPTDWKPGITDDGLWMLSAPVVAGAAQIGWGYVGPETAPVLAAFALGAADVPEKPAETVAFMDARAEARRAAWGDA